MSIKRTQLGILFLIVMIDLIGFGIVIPVLPRYAEHFQATPWQIGWLVGVFSLAQFIFSPFWGSLSDKIGRRKVLIISTIGTSIGFFTMGMANTLLILFVARLIDGISGGNIAVAQSYISDISAPEERAKRMGLIGVAFGVGFIIGPAIGGWTASHYGWSSPMFVAGGMSIVNTILIIFLLPESLPPKKRETGQKERIFFSLFHHVEKRIYLTVIATYFLMIAGFSLMTSLFALFLFHRYDLDAKSTGNILALIGLIGACMQGGMIHKLSKKYGDAHLASAGALLLAAGFVMLAYTNHVGTMIGSCLVLAIGNSLMMPTLSAISSRSADPAWQGRALGVMQSAGSLARWIGPTVAGALLMLDLSSGKEGYARTPFLVASGFMILAFFLSLCLQEKAISKT